MPNNRIKCSFSGHEMPPQYTAVQQYLSSKQYVKARNWYSRDYSEYLPYIVPDKKDERKLYCKITKRSLNKIPYVSS